MLPGGAALRHRWSSAIPSYVLCLCGKRATRQLSGPFVLEGVPAAGLHGGVSRLESGGNAASAHGGRASLPSFCHRMGGWAAPWWKLVAFPAFSCAQLVPHPCPVPALVSPSPEPLVQIPQRWVEEGVAGVETPRRDLGWGAHGAALTQDQQPPTFRPLPVSPAARTWPHLTERGLPAGPPRAEELAPCRASGHAP